VVSEEAVVVANSVEEAAVVVVAEPVASEEVELAVIEEAVEAEVAAEEEVDSTQRQPTQTEVASLHSKAQGNYYEHHHDCKPIFVP